MGRSTRTAVIDGEEGSLRAIFRAFDYQIDGMNPADRYRIYERRKAETLFFFVITFDAKPNSITFLFNYIFKNWILVL